MFVVNSYTERVLLYINLIPRGQVVWLVPLNLFFSETAPQSRLKPGLSDRRAALYVKESIAASPAGMTQNKQEEETIAHRDFQSFQAHIAVRNNPLQFAEM